MTNNVIKPLLKLRQIKSDLEMTRIENTTLKERILKLDADLKNIQTSLFRYCNIDEKQPFSEEINQLKGRIQKLEHMKNRLKSIIRLK